MMRKRFDPSAPFDACAESLRKQICDIGIEMLDKPEFQGLSAEDQLKCLMAGLMTGCVGVMLAFVDHDSHDEFIAVLAAFVPVARKMADEISADAPDEVLQ